MIEEERNRLHEESLQEFINEFNEDPFDKLMKEKWMQIRARYQDHLMCDRQDEQSLHLEEAKKLFMDLLAESLKRYENDPLNTDKGQIISKEIFADVIFYQTYFLQNVCKLTRRIILLFISEMT